MQDMVGRNYDRALRLMQRATAMPPRKVQYYDKVWIRHIPKYNCYCVLLLWMLSI